MRKEELLKAFQLMDELNDTVDRLSNLGVEVAETPLFNTAGCLFDMLIASNYTEEGQDWINWWYFERDTHFGNKAYNDAGEEICRTFDELYEYVKKFER